MFTASISMIDALFDSAVVTNRQSDRRHWFVNNSELVAMPTVGPAVAPEPRLRYRDGSVCLRWPTNADKHVGTPGRIPSGRMASTHRYFTTRY